MNMNDMAPEQQIYDTMCEIRHYINAWEVLHTSSVNPWDDGLDRIVSFYVYVMKKQIGTWQRFFDCDTAFNEPYIPDNADEYYLMIHLRIAEQNFYDALNGLAEYDSIKRLLQKNISGTIDDFLIDVESLTYQCAIDQ
jgi:hypothetical protein